MTVELTVNLMIDRDNVFFFFFFTAFSRIRLFFTTFLEMDFFHSFLMNEFIFTAFTEMGFFFTAFTEMGFFFTTFSKKVFLHSFFLWVFFHKHRRYNDDIFNLLLLLSVIIEINILILPFSIVSVTSIMFSLM